MKAQESADITELRGMARDWQRQFHALAAAVALVGYETYYDDHGVPAVRLASAVKSGPGYPPGNLTPLMKWSDAISDRLAAVFNEAWAKARTMDTYEAGMGAYHGTIQAALWAEYSKDAQKDKPQ